jgi:hypothetical protein
LKKAQRKGEYRYMSVPELPAIEEKGSLMGDFLGMFNFLIDPGAAAKLIRHKWFWVAPLILISILTLVIGSILMPLVQQVIMSQPPPPNTDPATYQRGLGIAVAIQKAFTYASPVTTALFWAIFAVILLGSCAVLGVKAKFVWLFNLIAGTALIQGLQAIAVMLILKFKGEITTTAELQPAMGLDIFMPEGASKMLTALVGFFSVFQIWYIVMLVLVFAAAFKVSKGKALAVVSPIIIIGLLFRLVGAAFQR